jgi:hypothetical protein
MSSCAATPYFEAMASARERMGSQTAVSLAPSMWLPPSKSECRFAMRPQPSSPNLIIGVFLVEP